VEKYFATTLKRVDLLLAKKDTLAERRGGKAVDLRRKRQATNWGRERDLSKRGERGLSFSLSVGGGEGRFLTEDGGPITLREMSKDVIRNPLKSE